MVGGLVEQQQFGRTHQRTGQLQAHPPAAAEAVDGLVQLFRLEAEAQQQGLRAGARIEGAGFIQRQVRVGHRFAIAGSLCSVELGLRLHQGHVALQHKVGRAVGRLGHLLGDLAQPPARWQFDIAGIGVQPSRKHREKARFAGAVAADQADLLAGVQRDAGIL